MNENTFKKQLQSTRLYSFKPIKMEYSEWRALIKVGYVGICGDLLHAGHLNILQFAKTYSQIVVAGILTDEAVMSYKRRPIICYEERCRIISHFEHVDLVIPQKTLSYRDNLRLVKPAYVFHGKDWAKGIQKETREEVLTVLKEFGGSLIEPDCYAGTSTTQIIKYIKNNH